ncbi:MAG: rhodanese-like domain-containing protein [Anaerolineales bacterium]
MQINEAEEGNARRKVYKDQIMKHLLFFSLVLLLVACQGQTPDSAGQQVSASGGTFTNVNPAELNTMLASKDFVFVNVHIPFEGDIAGTDLSIPFDQITEPANLAQLPSDKNTKIVLYCRSGRMSEIAASALVALGYTDIWNLDGGMLRWEQQGFEIIGN